MNTYMKNGDFPCSKIEREREGGGRESHNASK